MKTLNYTKSLLVLLLVAVIGITTTSAKTPETKRDVSQILKEAVYYPDFALREGNEGTVNVTFKVGDDGKLELKKVESTDKVLSEFVKKQFAAVDLKDAQIEKFKTYQIAVKFEIE